MAFLGLCSGVRDITHSLLYSISELHSLASKLYSYTSKK